MRRRTVHGMALAIGLAAFAADPALSGFTPATATVSLVEGKAAAQKKGKGTWTEVKVNDALGQGDVLRTEKDSRAELRLADGSVVRISAGSRVSIDQLQSDATAGTRKIGLNALFGRFWAHVVNLKGESSFAMKAGGSVIGVRGTAYDTQVNEAGEVEVKVFDGTAYVSNASGEEYAQVGTREGATIRGGELTEKATFDDKAMEKDDWVRWNKERDKVRIMVIVDERDVEGVTAPMPISETEVINALLTKYEFRVVDQAQVSKIREQDKARAAARGDMKAAQSLGEEMYADIVITGFAKAEKQTGLDVLERSGIKSVKTVITARTLRVDTGQVLSANTFTGKGADVTDSAAAAKSLVDAGRALSDYAVEKLIDAWTLMTQKGSTVDLMVENASYGQLDAVTERLRGILGAANVTFHAFANGVGTYSISTAEGTGKLAKKLDGALAGSAKLSVVEISGNRLKVRVQ